MTILDWVGVVLVGWVGGSFSLVGTWIVIREIAIRKAERGASAARRSGGQRL